MSGKSRVLFLQGYYCPLVADGALQQFCALLNQILQVEEVFGAYFCLKFNE
jgi:hypothetical protein